MSALNRVSRSATRHRRGFNLIELMVALAISAALLVAVMAAIDASFKAYQETTEEASTHTAARLVLARMLTLIRTGERFGPYPVNPQVTSVVASDWMAFQTTSGEILRLRWVPADETLYLDIDRLDDGLFEDEYVLLQGVINPAVNPFTLEWEPGKARLFRCTIDLSIIPDDNASVELDGDNERVIRLVASAQPRSSTYGGG